MKKLLAILFISFLVLNAFSQTRPPNKVKKAFEKQYPQATNANWTAQTRGSGQRILDWRVLFKLDAILHSSFYTYKAEWEITKSKIDKSDLPQAVLDAIVADYYDYDIVISATFIDTENEGYEVWLDNGREGFNVQYSEEGKTLLRTLTSNGYQPIDDDGNFVEK